MLASRIDKDSRPVVDRSTPWLKFVSLPVLFDEMRSDYGDEGEMQGAFRKFKTARNLVIDDLGAEKLNQFASEKLYLLLDYRYGVMLDTIITSNATPSVLADTHGDRLASRVMGFGPVREKSGDDRRIG